MKIQFDYKKPAKMLVRPSCATAATHDMAWPTSPNTNLSSSSRGRRCRCMMPLPSHTIAMSAATEAWENGGREVPSDSMRRMGGAVDMRAGGRCVEEEDEEHDEDEEDEVSWPTRVGNM
jgi:hypothetical protein